MGRIHYETKQNDEVVLTLVLIYGEKNHPIIKHPETVIPIHPSCENKFRNVLLIIFPKLEKKRLNQMKKKGKFWK